MLIRWRSAERKYTYYYGDTDTRFSVQIGDATGGGFAWLVFHTDFKGCFQGGVAETVEAAKAAAQEYLDTYANAKPSP
ncbi:MAG: hypothetical protein JWN44_2983 [Myxococcales bacterium]|nr:hypothetical protein [Myxococcales bacterium]